MMKVSVLGSFEVLRAGVSITPSAPKMRRVLALLVMNANHVVHTSQFIEELWEDRPPVSATTTLQTYVYQLRRLHQPGSRRAAGTDGPRPVPLLDTAPSGYILRLDPDAVDSHRFERLAELGRSQVEAGDLPAAAATLQEASRLWRGAALADVQVGPVLRAAVVWLEELRSSVLDLRVEALLALGQHHRLIGELTAAVAGQPTHEGLQAKLMLALYRCGRRSEALQSYQRARRTIADELGVEPGSALQQMHRAVLTADPSLDPPDTRGEVVRLAPAAEPPCQLPPALATLVGRREEAATARQVLAAGRRTAPPVVIAVGAPGAGKSAFCVNVAQHIRDDYPDGQLYAALTGPDDVPVDPGAVLADFLAAAGVPADRLPRSLEDRVRMFRSWIADRRMLVVLDDVVSTSQLLPLLPTGPGCGTLVAGRRRLSHPLITTTVELRPLDPADGLRLLTDVIGHGRVTRDLDAARQLVDECHGLPLLLHAAASQLELHAHWPIGRQLAQLRRRPPEPVDMTAGGPGMFASVRRTYRLMPASTQAAFRAIAHAEQPVGARHTARTLGLAEATAESLLEDLVQFQLAEVLPTGHGGETGAFRYRLGPAVRQAARSLDHPPELVRLSPVPAGGDAGSWVPDRRLLAAADR
jgi:DNA-binding SARP family transcriptional activator